MNTVSIYTSVEPDGTFTTHTQEIPQYRWLLLANGHCVLQVLDVDVVGGYSDVPCVNEKGERVNYRSIIEKMGKEAPC